MSRNELAAASAEDPRAHGPANVWRSSGGRARSQRITAGFLRVLLAPNVLLLIAFAIMLAYFGTRLPYFLTEPNTITVLQFSSPIFILAAGFTIVMIGGGIDLSIGAGAVLTGLVAGTLTLHGAPVPLAFLGGFLAAIASGFVNGLLVTRARINPLIVTLAMLYILEGIGYRVTGGLNLQVYNQQFLFAQQRWFGQPVPIYVLGAVLLLTWILLRATKLGRHIYALGGSADAARQCAFNVERYRIGLYTLGAVFTGIGGLLTASLTGNLAPTTGPGTEFAVATAVLLGGVSLAGGRGSIFGALIGVLFIGALSNGLVQTATNPELTLVLQGVLLIAAVAVDRIPRGEYS